MMRIAIQKHGEFVHSSTDQKAYIDYCEQNKIDYELVDAFQPDILSKLKNFDIFLWEQSIHSYSNQIIGRSLLNAVESLGIKVFPNFQSFWHFDNKIAESYYLEAVGAPIPKYWAIFDKNDALDWLKEQAVFPIVAKLKAGAGGNNVRLIRGLSEGKRYVKRMFGRGFSPAPKLLFKVASQYKSSRGNWEKMKSRIARAPEFFHNYFDAKHFPNETGYVYFQEFIPNDGFDIKVIVVNKKISYIIRGNRQDDFRASGSGYLEYNREKVPTNVLISARDTAEKMNIPKVGFDYVIDNRTGEGKIVEMCCGYVAHATDAAGGYWDYDLNWHENDGVLNSVKELLDMMTAQVRAEKGR